jgi:predicted dehydrogenase
MARVGLVGYGSAGSGFHAPLLRAAGLQIAAVVSRSAERAAQVRAELPDAAVFGDEDTLLAAGGLDLLVVASPTGRHIEHARAAVRAGVPVVVDKPLGCDAATAASLVDEAAAGGIPLTVFQNRRYDPEFATLREVVGSGAIGDVRRTELRWARWRPVPKQRWREQVGPQEGGGLLLDLHSHLIDQAVLLHGPVASVYAELAAWTTVGEDDTFVVLRHTSGHPTHVFASTVAGAPGPRVRLTGSTGTYLLGSAGEEFGAFPDADGPAGQHGWIVRGERREPVAARHADAADFYRAVAAALVGPDRQARMPVDPRDAVHVLAVIDAARASAAAGSVVPVERGPVGSGPSAGR